MPRMRGACHCGAVTVELDTERAVSELSCRRCDCTFCARHMPRYTSDRDGSAVIASRPGALKHYRFGHETADFLLCATCGVFIGAMFTHEGATSAVLNVNNFDAADQFPASPEYVSLDGESTEDRLARRARFWTPVELSEA